MSTNLGIILARAGSKGLPDKCVRELLGKPVIAYTFEHARESQLLSEIVFSTDSEPAKRIARQFEIEVIDRPVELATDTATVDAAARHAVETWERRHVKKIDVAVLLYGNIPIRDERLIDRAIDHLTKSGADSVRSVAPVSKHHPDWVHRLSGDRMEQFRVNSIYRRQDLEPLYYHDGAVAAVRREALFDALCTPDDHQSFLGRDRRAIVCAADDAVDIDEPIDLFLAEAILRHRQDIGARRDSRASERRDSRTSEHRRNIGGRKDSRTSEPSTSERRDSRTSEPSTSEAANRDSGTSNSRSDSGTGESRACDLSQGLSSLRI